MARITRDEFNELVREELPLAHEMGLVAERIGDGEAMLRLPFRDNLLRPGGTVAGPVMMMVADAAMYAVILGMIGKVTMAVTTSFNINFLRLPPRADMVAEGTMIKLGKRLAVLEVTLYSEGDHEPVAHATGTYSIPPDTGG